MLFYQFIIQYPFMPPFIHSRPFTIVRAMRFFFSSTLTTQTFTTSPTFTTSEGWRMKRSAMREMCTRPS